VTFAALDTTHRYAVRTENLHPGGPSFFIDNILSFWGRGSSARVNIFISDDGGVTYDYTANVAAATTRRRSFTPSAPRSPSAPRTS